MRSPQICEEEKYFKDTHSTTKECFIFFKKVSAYQTAESCSQIHTYISQMIDTTHQIQVLQSCWLQCEYFYQSSFYDQKDQLPKKEGSTSALFLCLLMKHCLLWHEGFVIKPVVFSSSPQTRLKFNLFKIKKYFTILNITRHNIISEFPIILRMSKDK